MGSEFWIPDPRYQPLLMVGFPVSEKLRAQKKLGGHVSFQISCLQRGVLVCRWRSREGRKGNKIAICPEPSSY